MYSFFRDRATDIMATCKEGENKIPETLLNKEIDALQKTQSIQKWNENDQRVTKYSPTPSVQVSNPGHHARLALDIVNREKLYSVVPNCLAKQYLLSLHEKFDKVCIFHSTMYLENISI